MPDLLINRKRRSDTLLGACELQRRKELPNGRRNFRTWPLLPVPSLPPAAALQAGPSIDWPQDVSFHGEDEWPYEEALGQAFAPVCEAPFGVDGLEQPKAESRSSARKFCIPASVALHLCCAAFFLSLPAPEAVEIAGGGSVSVMLVGEQAFDSLSAGAADGDTTMRPVEQARVEEVKAVEVADQSVEAATTQQALESIDATKPMSEPITEAEQTEASVPTETTEVIRPPEYVDQAVVQTDVEMKADSVMTGEYSAIDPTALSETGELQPGQEVTVAKPKAQPQADAPPVKPRKTAEPPVQPDKKRVDKKAPSREKLGEHKADEKKVATRKHAENNREVRPAPANTRKGEAGEGAANAQRGASAQADSAGRSDPGNAAVYNYPGKVAAKLRRALKYPRSAVSSRSGEARVAFTVLPDGSATGIRVVSSSGSPVLDQAAMEAVRRASPFPPIPTEAGRRQWPFAVPVLFKR